MDSRVALLMVSFVACSTAYQIDITGADARSYQSIENSENQFKYGYQVSNVNDQFQHKLKSSDNVTYGCYGYTYSSGDGVHRTFFVADQFGYRTVLVGQPITIYPTPGTAPVLRQWQELTFPTACFGNGNARGNSFSQTSNIPNVQSSERGRSGLEFASTELRPIAVPYDHEQGDIQSAGSDVVPVTASANHPRASNNSNQCWKPFVGGAGKSFIQSLQCVSDDKRKNNQIITLFYPFRVACSDMEEFEKELKLLVSKFDRST